MQHQTIDITNFYHHYTHTKPQSSIQLDCQILRCRQSVKCDYPGQMKIPRYQPSAFLKCSGDNTACEGDGFTSLLEQPHAEPTERHRNVQQGWLFDRPRSLLASGWAPPEKESGKGSYCWPSLLGSGLAAMLDLQATPFCRMSISSSITTIHSRPQCRSGFRCKVKDIQQILCTHSAAPLEKTWLLHTKEWLSDEAEQSLTV